MTAASPSSAPSGRRPILDLSATLVRRGYVVDYEAGERPLPLPDKVLRYGRAALLPLSTVACVRTTRKVVGLTYDDGPDPEHTPRVLEALAAHGAKATFFVMVEQAEKHPALVTRIQAEGHEVALHGIDHTRLSGIPLRQATALIRDGKQRLERLTGTRMTLFRPTYGAQTMQQYIATRALGMEVVIWSGWARDWDSAAAEEVAERALGSIHQGGFILLHDFAGDGIAAHDTETGVGLDRGRATELMLAGMAGRGYTSQTVTSLLRQYPAVRTIWAERYSPNAPTGMQMPH
jgi:peptidoglycan/xylan/chitin deacetylase (PgdA/CDA1 family)